MLNIPKHVAIIMDGNRRWANMRGLSSIYGHNKGAQNVKRVVIKSIEFGINELTIFAFSTENWNRIYSETTAIFKLFEKFLKSEIVELNNAGVKLEIIGDRNEVHSRCQDVRITGKNCLVETYREAKLLFGQTVQFQHSVNKVDITGNNVIVSNIY